AADAPLSGAPQGGGVNPGHPGKNDYLMKLQTDKCEIYHKAVTDSAVSNRGGIVKIRGFYNDFEEISQFFFLPAFFTATI
ncbi:MAG: hypothetical protein P1P81_06170, partial [Desulfobulbales bacterium]|nr:hypothetical protein [Desulfobulbales bacterium]